MEARYLRVRNLKEWQHYKDRCPPWIKLHRTLITGEDKQLDDFLLLDEWEQWQLVRIWLLASQCTDELLAFDERWMRRAIRTTRKVPLEKFIRLGFLEILSADESDAIRASKRPAETPPAASTVLAEPASGTGPAASALVNAGATRAAKERTEKTEKTEKTSAVSEGAERADEQDVDSAGLSRIENLTPQLREVAA